MRSLAIIAACVLPGLILCQAATPYPVISRSQYDINGDGQAETIEIILVHGNRYNDQALWCGGGEKWEGAFNIRIKRNGKILSEQRLNKLFYGPNTDPMFFLTPEFPLVFRDYNGDGCIDFNLGQYGNCNGWFYRLFTIRKNGKVERLPIAGDKMFFVSLGDGDRGSTPDIVVRKGLVSFSYYDNSRGRGVTEFWRWNGKLFVFVKEKSG